MNTRRYPRTLEEAFGPYTSQKIEEPPVPYRKADFVIAFILVCVVAALVGGVL